MSKEALELQGITFEGLMALKYGDELKDKFAELGVPQVWQGGKKKVTMIKEAIELLSKAETGQQIASVLAEDLIEVSIIDAETEEVLGDYVPADAIKEDALKQSEEVGRADTKQTGQNATPIKKVVKKVAPYPLDVLDENLKRIQSNLSNGIPAQRNILLKKLTELEAIKLEFYPEA